MESRQRRWQKKMRDSYRCVKCGKSTGGSEFCEYHKRWVSEYKKLRRKANKEL